MTTETEMKVLTCPGPPEHQFEIPKGRGRPPRYCDEHKPTGGKKPEEEQMSEQSKPRPRPGTKSESSNEGNSSSRPRPRAPRVHSEERHWGDEPIPSKPESEADGEPPRDLGLRRLPPPGRGDRGSRAKSESAANRAIAQQDSEVWPRGIGGKPLARIEFSASELIPTGQYANVTIGPAHVTAFVDLGRDLNGDDAYFTAAEKDVLVKACNELADTLERDVLAVQRNLVLDSLQESSDGSK